MCFTPLYLLTKPRWGVHFLVGYVHLLIIPWSRKKPELLRSDLDFCAIVENECDAAILVDNRFFDHHHPDGIVPSVHSLRLAFQGSYKKAHCLILLTEPGAFSLQAVSYTHLDVYKRQFSNCTL